MGVVAEDEAEDEVQGETEVHAPPAEIASDDAMMLLQSVPERVTDLLFGLSLDQLQYRHGPAFPTADEVARHLAAGGARFDVQVTAACLETAAAEPAEPSQAALAEVLADWQRHRRRAVDLLRGLPKEGWDRSLDDETLIELCRRSLGHELGHLSQLRNLTALIPVA